ncbi:hypothetical protein [Streptomyces europaeiscabiei]|uniref:hypothetical protein n=1 Tax=Streptomyces europaeiscabiei TaxID=146819 RepID=UPI0029A88CBC|nr:hypothetical protein [Streptomyces europaeiscabiei]MDX3585959.1 hypothetical protein [Streptomyces europaeiscabiei]
MTFAPRTWVVGEVVTAALLNQEIRDQFNSFFGAWTDYSGTFVWGAESGTAPAIGNGVIVARYMKIGRTVDYLQRLTMGSTTTYGNGAGAANYYFSLPAAPASTWSGHRGQTVIWRDESASINQHGTAQCSTANHANGSLRQLATPNGAGAAFWDSVAPFAALAADDVMWHQGRYEAAS